MLKNVITRASVLKAAVSAATLGFAAGLSGQAAAEEPTAPALEGVWESPYIVVNNLMNPNAPAPGGALDNAQNLTGVGLMAVRGNPATTGVGVCSGTLINPRTVIFAAHCVNTRPASAYGSLNGTPFGPWATGTPISFGFRFDSLPGLLSFYGLDGGGLAHRTNAALNVYNVEHVWYDTRSLAPSSAGFLEADVAIATLDTPAWGVPTWVMLFTPLTGETHAIITGYGGNGTSASVGAGPLPNGTAPIDWRRRAAENMISFLGSLNDRNDWLFGGVNTANPQSLYQLDFDSHTGEGTGFDFDLFDGPALPREGTTAGGDSGGPLIADQYFETPVVVGVLSGGSRFFAAQRFSTYGTSSFYQPLFLFWEQVVANNPYVYAGNLAGNRSWTDPSHWIQNMDPAYGIEVAGQLVNALPGFNAQGVSGQTYKFGNVCFLDDCLDISTDAEFQPWAVGTPNSIHIPGGPGSLNFVPNNVIGNPSLGIRPRYYDVTLGASGATWLNSAVTIDRFTQANGYSTLDIRTGGSLSVLGDATIISGLLNVDGVMNSGEMLSIQGIITGSGLINPTFFTSVAGAIAPGGTDLGTLSIRGDVVLGSASNLFIELNRERTDLLRILADPAQGTTGIISLGGDLRLSKAAGAAPRHGQVFTLILADGSVQDTFDRVFAQIGVLNPEMIYNANSVQIRLQAGNFSDVILGPPPMVSFAHALDRLRAGSYSLLYDLYGELDVMDFASLHHAFQSLTPNALLDAHALMSIQGSAFGDTLQQRMALIARSGASGFSVMGAPQHLFAFGGDEGLAAAAELAFKGQFSETRRVAETPNGVSAFLTAGYGEERASPVSGRRAATSNDGMRTWHIVGGVEHAMGALTLGVAGGYSRGAALQYTMGAAAENELAQAAFYGVYRFENGAYLSAMAGAGSSRVSTERRFSSGLLDYHMPGDMNGDVVMASLEGGVNLNFIEGMTLTPHVAVRQFSLRTHSFTEAGGFDAALQVSGQTYERTQARMGLRLAGERALSAGWRFTPALDAALVANLSGDESGVWARFAAVPDEPFHLPGMARDAAWGEITGGLDLVRGATSIGLRMETSVGRQELHEDRYTARFVQRF